MDDLVEVYVHSRTTEIHEIATSFAIAFHSPKDLDKLEPKKNVEIDVDSLPAMMRIPKKGPAG